MKLVMDDAVLNKLLQSMYRLPHRSVLYLQDTDSCLKFVDLISLCLKNVFPDQGEEDQSEEKAEEKKSEGMDKKGLANAFSTEEISAIHKAISLLKSEVVIKWMPSYGSAIILHRGDLQAPGEMTISVLGLDNHSFFLHHDEGDGYQHEAEALDYKILVAGTIDEAKVESFWERLQRLHSAATPRVGNERTAAGGQQGHQYTPAFVHALVTQAIKCHCPRGRKCNCPNVVPRGGFTDVGRHTGGSPRNTSFALSRFLFGWCLAQCGFVENTLFRKALLCVHLRILEDRVLRAEEDSEGAEGLKAWRVRADLDVTFRLLEVISMEGSELCENGHSIKFVYDEAAALRLRVDTIVERLAQTEANRFMLPDVDKILQDPGSFRSPQIQLTKEEATTSVGSRDYDERIKKNIGPSALFEDVSKFDMGGLLSWLKSPEFQGRRDSVTVSLRVRTVENVFWNRAMLGFDTDYIDDNDVERMICVVNEYRTVFHVVETESLQGDHLMVELRSRELLVVWIAYCLAFAKVRKAHSDIMANTGVCLRFDDLEHLVLSDKKSWEVLKKVASFLHRNHQSGNTELFSFRAPDATFSFAESFAKNDRELQRIWKAEKSDAEIRMHKHWEEVTRKKAEAARLRLEISDLHGQLATAERNSANALSDYNWRRGQNGYASRSELTDCETKVQSLKNRIASRKSNLKNALEAPTPVCQPLPRVENCALRWLFFLHMPSTLRILSTLSITGQQMLVPRPWKVTCGGSDGTELVDVMSALRQQKGECLTSFYNNHQRCNYYSPGEQRRGVRGNVGLDSSKPISETLPKRIGPSSVDRMHSREDGVWFPDAIGCCMDWTGGTISWDGKGGESFDPFRVPREWVVSYFTERLGPREQESLQWAMRLEQNSSDSDKRGNRPLANQDSRPDWLSKTQFLSFCNMRAFPFKQLRNLLVAVRERSLPFQNECVHTLLKQTLFHVGGLYIRQSDHDVALVWKHDLIEGELLVTAEAVVQDFVDEIRESPNSFLHALIVGDIAGFLSDWGASIKEISRQLARATFEWAREFGTQAESTENSADAVNFRVRQCLFLGISILCLAQGPLSNDDTKLIVECHALKANVCVDEGEVNCLRTTLSLIERRCDSAISQCIGRMMERITVNLSFLTDAIRSVIAVVPPRLRWIGHGPYASSSSFTAVGSDDCKYSINVLTGVVLVNGLPPSSLPTEILEHPLYKRSFEDRNFEVVSKNEVFETVRRVGGFLYSFKFASNGDQLCITETSESGTCLELLDGTTSGIELWAKELPVRLKEMHSHWLSRDTNTIILRGRTFFERDVSFVLRLSSTEDGDFGDCHIVPDHLKNRDWRDTVVSSHSFPKLVLHDSPLLSVFSKFEERPFVHFVVSGSGSETSLSVSLPRHGLAFEYHDGEFHCVEVSGFVLAKCQLLKGSLFGFEQYLVLRKSYSQAERHETSLLVADGDIVNGKLDGSTLVQTSKACDEDARWHKYDMHPRFKTFSTGIVSSRLHLSALHASTSFLSPDKDSLLTGFERAIELIRGCWLTRALSGEEASCLVRLVSICKGRYPSLCLLCSDILRSSMSVSFLFNGNASAAPVYDELKTFPTDSANKYLSDLEYGLLNHRSRLTPEEERRVLGQSGRVPDRPSTNGSITVGSPPVLKDIASRLENLTAELRGTVEPNRGLDPQHEFPLDADSQTSLEVDIFAELRTSWTLHQQTSMPPYHLNSPDISTKIANLRGYTSHSREDLEDYILSVLNNEDGTTTPSGTDLKRLSRRHIQCTARDLLSVVLQKGMILNFSSCIQEDDSRILREYVIEWLRLCVVEDKLARLSQLLHDAQGMQRELLVFRNWDPSIRPAWLVFEVENCIQIWQEQALVASHLIENGGDIVQLNMGMGKTRVIIPLLLLHWAFHGRSSAIPRVNVLPQLLSEACDFFHQRLTASIFNVKLFMLPFSRDRRVTSRDVTAIQSFLRLCRSQAGFVIVAPEHRLSFELKIKELELSGDESSVAIASQLQKVHESAWVDVLDESDELLHHRFQLIYATGSVQELPGGPHRWRAAEALLGVIHGDRDVHRWLETHEHFALRSQETTKEAFRRTEITSRKSMAVFIPDFCRVLAEAVLASPPHELEWLQGHAKKDLILASLLRKTEPAQSIKDLSDDKRNDILALRGLLVGGLLVHCLQKRHRVDFGVSRPGTKKLSVPFRGADTPSLRSEFSHPDCSIVFTILAYYDDGLSEGEVIDAFSKLNTLGKNVQRKIYSQWYILSKDRLQEEETHLVDRVEKIDLANRSQRRLLVTMYQQNVRVINFWLNHCVFPLELQYYPKRLTATSWNLANNPTHIVGFSGTNDNHRLLPRQVRQCFVDIESSNATWKSLLATNGRMLELLLAKTTSCLSLSGSDNIASILKLLLNESDLRKVQAIIDAGALLAGFSNEDVARKLVDAFQLNGISRFKGVVFFDNRSPEGQWMALEPSGRLLPKNQSPVQESEAFAIFDEPRCRGSDLKLDKTALAILTIGPKMCKDKLMQAAGRMRSLAQGQSLIIAGTDFLFREIMDARGSHQITAKVILEWTLRNTVKANTEGMVPWANQGLFFCTSQGASKLSVEDERLSLEDYYGGSFHDASVSAAVESARTYHTRRIGDAVRDVHQEKVSMMDDIVKQAHHYGESMVHSNCGMDEECERELELEREVEEEKEVEIPLMAPMKENDWNKTSVLGATSLDSLARVVEITSLGDFIRNHVSPTSLSRFAWTGDVHGTTNFFNAVLSQSGLPLSSFNHYLRLVDTFLVFPSRQVLLVSDREADELIALLWKHAGNKATTVTLCHFSFLRSALDGQVPGLTKNAMTLGHKWSESRMRLRWNVHTRSQECPSDTIMAIIQLFAGETMYPTQSRKDALKDILRGPGATHGPPVADPEYLVDARGNSQSLAYSDLEAACRELAREEQEGEVDNVSGD